MLAVLVLVSDREQSCEPVLCCTLGWGLLGSSTGGTLAAPIHQLSLHCSGSAGRPGSAGSRAAAAGPGAGAHHRCTGAECHQPGELGPSVSSTPVRLLLPAAWAPSWGLAVRLPQQHWAPAYLQEEATYIQEITTTDGQTVQHLVTSDNQVRGTHTGSAQLEQGRDVGWK